MNNSFQTYVALAITWQSTAPGSVGQRPFGSPLFLHHEPVRRPMQRNNEQVVLVPARIVYEVTILCRCMGAHVCRLLGSGVVGDAIGEGMGLSYKAFAISSSDAPVPVAFETDGE